MNLDKIRRHNSGLIWYFQGIEDYLGDMDMKIASTREGVTAIQADIKTQGLPMKVVTEAIEQSIRSKNHILDIMHKCISSPRQVRKDCWPVTKEFRIDANQRGQLFGPGGMNLKKIFLETGVHLTETESNVFNIFAPSPMSLNEAEALIKELLMSKTVPNLEFGGIYVAKIVEMKENGVMVTLYDGMKPTLIHVAQLDSRRVSVKLYNSFQSCRSFFLSFLLTFNDLQNCPTIYTIARSLFLSSFSLRFYSIRLQIRQHWDLK